MELDERIVSDFGLFKEKIILDLANGNGFCGHGEHMVF